MAKNPLRNLIKRCNKRHANPLQQRKTSIAAAVYNESIPYDYTVHIAHLQSVTLNALEEANVSFMPIGRAPGNDLGPRKLNADWYKRLAEQQTASSWELCTNRESWGIQIYTGIPSERFGARWHDVDFNYESINFAPDQILLCIDALVGVTANPLITMTKSGGIRFSCRIPEYLHPCMEDDNSYFNNIHSDHRSVYPRILGDKACSRWDARYEILMGDILDPPILSRDLLFAPIDILFIELNELLNSKEIPKTDITNKVMTIFRPYEYPFSLGSRRLDLAREALKRRGFSYVGENNNFHQWTLFPEKDSNRTVLLWERDGTVWIRASAPHNGLPIEATPITDVWDDTGIIPTSPSRILTLTEEFLNVQQKKISPLSIKRIAPILHQSNEQQNYSKDVNQFQSYACGDGRIIVRISNNSVLEKSEIASYYSEQIPLCVNVPDTKLVEEVEERLHNSSSGSINRWKPRNYNWDEVKDIPHDKGLENPFQHGNVCIDAERCNTLEEKGGDPKVSICPNCPVYEQCQQKGYLSQYTSFPRSDIQILNDTQVFFNPEYEDIANEILEHIGGTERLSIVHTQQIHDLFIQCELSVETLRDWMHHWKGEALGNFASYLMNALVLKGGFNQESVKRIRSALIAFQRLGDIISKQMCEVNVPCKIFEEGFVDTDSGKKLAEYTIEFENGVNAFIPLDNDASEAIKQKELPYFRLESFLVDEEMKIAMPIAKAIKLGILNIDTVANIQNLPTVNPKPNWTLWNQLSYFFEHYTRDEDARVRWDERKFVFWIPPKLHPNIKRLMIEIPKYNDQYIKKVFPDEVIDVVHTKPTPLIKNNRIFQIRTGIYSRESMLSYHDICDVLGINEMGQRFFARILEEIRSDTSVSHAVVSFLACIRQLEGIVERENVHFFKYTEGIDGLHDIFNKAQVIWIVGAPEPSQGLIWRETQILFGNDDKPLRYEKDKDTGLYLDDRMQHIYEMNISVLLKSILKCVRLDQQSEKTVVLVSGLPIQGITDMPNTLLFDWEDFEIAGSLEELTNVVATRQRFETDKENLTGKSSRQEVERILGCSSRQANRVLQKLRGGAPLRIPFRVQILALLAEGNKKTAELVNAIDGNPEAVKNELKRLIDRGEIKRVQRGLYSSV